MTVESDKAHRGLRNIRKRFDVLWRKFDHKRPTTYAKMRNFVDELVEIVNDETINAGFLPIVTYMEPKVKDKGKVIDRVEVD